MTDSAKRKAYKNQYDKDNCKQVKLKLNKNTDTDIISILEQLPNMQKYFKDLVRADIKNKKVLKKHITVEN